MNQEMLRDAYLSVVGRDLEVTETPRGFVVWAPLLYSDGDGVTLSVYPSSGGWLVTDEGSTLARLADAGAPIDSRAFMAGWDSLSRVTQFVPGTDSDDDVIQAWGDQEHLGEAMCRVAEASVRAEGLLYARSGGQPRREFRSTIRSRMAFLAQRAAVASRGLVAGDGKMRLRSGRIASVTSTLVRDDAVVIAVQAMGATSKESRTVSHEHTFTLYSQSDLPRDSKLSVIKASADWDAGMKRELGDVSTVIDYRDAHALDEAIDRSVELVPVLAGARS